jgi:hypothetical protein
MFGKANSKTKNTGNHMKWQSPVWLGQRLSELREKRGLSQTLLADMAQIGRAQLSQN